MADSANKLIDTLEYKIVEKDFNVCMLYYKMEEYQAAITSFEDFLKNNPTTVHREEIINYMVLTYANYADNSVVEKQRERYELALEKYNTLVYMYPESKYIAELEPVVEKVKIELTNIKTK
jgi:outer membrane protein assembly factor BamD